MIIDSLLAQRRSTKYASRNAACTLVRSLTQGEDTGGQDPQTELHSDIYFTSHKAWFYLTDVTLASGPLLGVMPFLVGALLKSALGAATLKLLASGRIRTPE
jgi:hypothetical protein